MSANTWYAISLVGYFASLIGLIITVVLFIRQDIPDVYGDLSGRTVERELKSMRESRETKGVRRAPAQKYRSASSGVAVAGKPSAKKTAGRTSGRTAGRTGKLKEMPVVKKGKSGTAQMGGTQTEEKKVLHSRTDRLPQDVELLYEQFDPRQEYSRQEPRKKTDLLPPEPESTGTALLIQPKHRKATQVLAENGTAVLEKGTALLPGGTVLLTQDEPVEAVKFSLTRSWIVVHSEESIIENPAEK